MSDIFLLILFLLAKCLYIPLNRRKSKYYWNLPVDNLIQIVPLFVIPYLVYFPFIAVSIIFLWNTPYINSILIGLIIAYAIASFFWFLFPNGVKRPAVNGNSVLHSILRFLYKTDKDTNGLPSAHVFVTVICAFYLSVAFPLYYPVIWTLALLIVLSTLFTKQHYLIDVLGGSFVSLLVVLITGF